MDFNRYLYYQIMRNISNSVKRILNEDIQNFDVTDYRDDDIVDHDTIKSTLDHSYKNVNDTNILWSDLNVYTLQNIIDDIPQSGYPIGINIIDNKYVSLRYMSIDTPETGTTRWLDVQFADKQKFGCPDVKFYNYISNLSVEDLKVKLINNKPYTYYKPVNNKDIVNRFKRFNGKEQTQLILNAIIKNNDNYPAAKCVYEFNPGNTSKGDWYIPEIGELIQIYILFPVINYICKILNDKGYNNIYNKIGETWYWSSTFFDSSDIYNIFMGDTEGEVTFDDENTLDSVLAMYQRQI